MTYEVSLVVRGVEDADEHRLEEMQRRMEATGAIDPAIVFYPQDHEIGMMFQIEEEALGRLLQSEGDRAAA